MKSLAVPLPASLRQTLRRPDHKILDVGCGNSALDIATHLVDAMPDSNAERGGNLEVPAGKTFTEGTIESIPFPNGTFDFVHASHILEHVASPATAIAELERVARAGYVETPAAVVEQWSNYASGKGGWDFHRWYVWAFPNQEKLYFRPKSPEAAAVFCDCRYGRSIQAALKHGEFQDIYSHFPYHATMTQLVWSKRIPFEIWAPTQMGALSVQYGCTCAYAAFYAQVRRYFGTIPQLRRRFQFRRRAPEIYRILRQTLRG